LKAEKLLFWALLVLLIWAPIPLGSRRVWSLSVLEIGAFMLTMAWLGLWAAGRAQIPAAARAAWPALVVLGLWLGEQAIYLVPLPASWVDLLSPGTARTYHLTDILGIDRSTMWLSLDPYASRTALLMGLAYASLFFLTLVLVNGRRRLFLFIRGIVYAAVAMSIFAVLMHVSNERFSFFGEIIDHGDRARGTFTNPNHLAGYLEMTLSLGIGLLVAGLSDRRGETWRHFVAHIIEWILSPKMVLRLALCILVIALTTTHSRMGNTAFFSSLLIVGIVGLLLSRHAPRNTIILLVSLVVIDLAIVGSWFGVEKLAQRIEETTVGDVEHREEPAAYAIGIIKNYPVFGSGPGSFYTVFPRYRVESLAGPFYWDHAHNDYFEIASESGILGITIIGLFVVLSLGAALKAQWLRRDPLMRGISFASLMGVTSILIHSWADFNLQIPSNAAYFMVLLALGWISLHMGRSDRTEEG
jgi:O-antigen ligase